MAGDWKEDLGDNCPPESSKQCTEMTVFRLVSDPIAPDNFHSLEMRDPRTNQSETVRCKRRSLSISFTAEGLSNAAKSPKLKNMRAAEIKWDGDSGRYAETPNANNPSHGSWWVAATFAFSQAVRLI